jgi:murein DD-endopeptidase MepM/ murein hydrolase activator NlpD
MMPNLIKLQRIGNEIKCIFDDGTKLVAVPTPGDIWMITGNNGSGPGPGPVDPPPVGGAKTVIYPCIQHTVVDYDGSFAGHEARTPPSVNPGCDYAPLSIGHAVWAVADGTVTDIDNSISGSGGRLIHIDHTALGTGSDYLHLSSINVAVGQTVTQGQQIGLSGASADGSENGVGAHLHISYRTVLGHAYTNTSNIDFDAYIKSL